MSIFSYMADKKEYKIMEKKEAPLVTQEQIESIKKRLWELENPPKFKVLDKVLWDFDLSQVGRYKTPLRFGYITVTITGIKVDDEFGECSRYYEFRITDETLEVRTEGTSAPIRLQNGQEFIKLEGYLKPLKSG